MPSVTKVRPSIPPVLLERKGPVIDWSSPRKANKETDDEKLKSIACHYPAIRTFLDMARIASPPIVPGSPKESEVRENMIRMTDVISDKFQELDVPKKNISFDENGVQIINVPGTKGYKDKRRFMFIAHSDIVPADLDNPIKEIKPKLILHETPEGKKLYIATDGTTTLGADDKAGIASVWEAVRLLRENKIPHVPIEIVISRDEESGNESLYELDTSKLKAKHAVIADHFMDFCIGYGCSSYVIINIEIRGLSGGHTGLDVHKSLNAALILNELFNQIGDGVMEYDPNQPGTPLISKTAYDFGVKDSHPSAIPGLASYSLSLRSRSKKLENEEIRRIKRVTKDIERKYKALNSDIKISIKVKKEPAWLGEKDSPLVKLLEKTAHDMGHDEVFSGVGHAFTQGNIFCVKKNHYGEKFDLAIAGPDVENLHSVDEKTGIQSIIDVGEWFSKTVIKFSTDRKLSG